MNLKKHKGFSFYDILISLVILIFTSLCITKIFVGAVDVKTKNTILDDCTFSSIEVIENIKNMNDLSSYETNEYLSSFEKIQNDSGYLLTKQLFYGDDIYTQTVTIELIETYDTEKIKEATSYKDELSSEIIYEIVSNNLYKIVVDVLDENNNNIYSIETYLTESRKVLS